MNKIYEAQLFGFGLYPFTHVPHVSNLMCSTASVPRITRKCHSSTSIPFTLHFEINHLAVSPTYTLFI